MEKLILKSIAILLIVFSFGFIKAQTTSTIQEVTLSNNDGFNGLRNLIDANFNYTNPDLEEGSFVSIVEFNLAENGKIKNVHTSGDCKFVSTELENVIQNLLFKVNLDKLNENALSTNYKMPVVVNIKNR